MPRPRLRNVLRGKTLEAIGIKELVGKIRSLDDALANREAIQVLGTAGRIFQKAGEANAKSRGWPSDAIDGFFVDDDPSHAIRGKRRIAVLAGVNKQVSMVEWTATANPLSPKAKVPAGGKVAMSRATMYEFGTSIMAARPAARPALDSTRGQMRSEVISGLTDIIKRRAK